MQKTTLERMHEMVERFNRDLLGINIPDQPTLLSGERSNFRIAHLEEELVETADAFRDRDMQGVVDGLIDLTYVALGALVEMGVCIGGPFEEVHDRNMAKVRGTNSKRPNNAGYDAVKPEGWTPPDLMPYLAVTKMDLVSLWASEPAPVRKVGVWTSEPTPVRKVGADRGRKKVLVMGYARHGKDTAAEMISQRYGLSFTSSSMFCAEHVMMPYFDMFVEDELRYDSVEECFEDRGNHRQEWYEQIRDYNRPDAATLGKAIFAEHDIYCGLRSRAEFNALQNSLAFDISVWIDATDRGIPPEANESCTVRPWMADYVIDNGGDEEQLHFNIKQLLDRVMS